MRAPPASVRECVLLPPAPDGPKKARLGHSRELLTEDAGLQTKIAAAADGIMQEVIRDSAVAALGVRTHDTR